MMDKDKVRNYKRERNEDDFLVSDNKRYKDDLANSNTNYQKNSKNVFPTNDNFLLPQQYLNLLDIFISLDLVVNKLISSRESPSINRIEKVLQQMNKSNFTENIFGQILSVFPESYQYEYEKTPMKLTRHNFDRLKILPNLKFGMKSDVSPRKSTKCLSLSQLLLRKNTFKERLIALVKEKHDEFLLNVKKMKIEDIRKLKAIRWASDFDLDSVGPIVVKCLDKHNQLSLESPFLKSFAKTLTIETEKSGICKDLFGTCVTKKDKEDENHVKVETVSLPDNVKQDKEDKTKKKRSKPLNQSQLSYGYIESQSTNVNQSQQSIIVSSPMKDVSGVQRQRLPFHMRILLDLFVSVDKTVHSLLMRGDLIYMSRVLKTVSIAKTYTETHFSQLLTVYPEAYKLRWEQTINKHTNKLTNKLDIVITPQLRLDGTQVALSSPDKGFIKFDCVRLTQRRQRFLDRCLAMVDESEAEWRGRGGQAGFNVDLHVAMVRASPLPPRPVGTAAGGRGETIRSVADMFSIIKRRHGEETREMAETCDHIVSEKLRSLPPSLLARVRANKARRHLLPGGEARDGPRRMMMERLPGMVAAMLAEFGRSGGGRAPLEKAHVMRVTCGDATMDEATFDDHVTLLNDLFPGMLQLLPWTPPCLQLGDREVTLDEVTQRVASVLL